MVVDSVYYLCVCVVEFVCFSSLSCGCEGSLVIVGSDGNVGFLGLRFSFYYFL